MTPDTLARAAARGIDAKARLADNDGHGFFEALGDQVITGPTLTNVNDFRAILVLAPPKGRPRRPRIDMRRHRNAKIVATLGPASSSPELIRGLFEAGADVFRLNFSHGTHEDHQKRYDIIREHRAGDRPAYRHPRRSAGTETAGRHFRRRPRDARHRRPLSASILTADPATSSASACRIRKSSQALSPGVQLLLDDGKVRLEVESCGRGSRHDPRRRRRRAVRPQGSQRRRRRVAALGAHATRTASTWPTRLELGADWIALSFVQRPEDVEEIRSIVAGRAGIMSKLEKPSAIEHLDEIVELSDAVMVARGDLGVEMPPEQVPPIQRRIVRACRQAGKPSIVATQMLELMISRSDADPRRSLRCGLGHLPWRRCGDAVGGIGLRAIPARSGRDDEPHHHGCGERPRLLPADE